MNPVALNLAPALWAVEFAATLAFALSGLMEASRKQLDAVGVVVVAGLAAFGGGTLRDVLLDRRPFFWVEHPHYVWGIFVLTAGAMLFMRQRHMKPTARGIVWPDALGLGLFAASGTLLSLDAGLTPLVAVLMGVITATFGGVLRDIVCNEIPTAFRDHRPYALCAFAGGWVVVAVRAAGGDETAALALGTVVAFALRALALWRNWRVPAWQTD